MSEGLLRIGELAAQARVSPRTVDFYTGLGLLAPARRTAGNFRLYHPGCVRRIQLIRSLESQGIRLDDIARALPALQHEDVAAAPQHELSENLASLQEQVRVLQEVASASPRAQGLLATVTARAHALLATAAVLAAELASEIDHLPPM